MNQNEKEEVLEALQELSRFFDGRFFALSARMHERFDSLDRQLADLAHQVELLDSRVTGVARLVKRDAT
jgi:hypothetical protein